MGEKSLIPLVQEIAGPFDEQWRDAIRPTRGDNGKANIANTGRGMFEPGAEGRAQKLAEQMLQQAGEMKTRQQIAARKLGRTTPRTIENDGFEPGE